MISSLSELAKSKVDWTSGFDVLLNDQSNTPTIQEEVKSGIREYFEETNKSLLCIYQRDPDFIVMPPKISDLHVKPFYSRIENLSISYIDNMKLRVYLWSVLYQTRVKSISIEKAIKDVATEINIWVEKASKKSISLPTYINTIIAPEVN